MLVLEHFESTNETYLNQVPMLRNRENCCYGNRCHINLDEDSALNFDMWSGNYDIFQIKETPEIL